MAIDLNEDLLWFDDVLMLKEEEILREAGQLDSFIRMNYYKERFIKGMNAHLTKLCII